MVVNHLPIIYQLHPFDCYSHVYIMVISILYPDEIGAVSRFQSQKNTMMVDTSPIYSI